MTDKEQQEKHFAQVRQCLDEAESLLDAIMEDSGNLIEEEQRAEILSAEKVALWQENQSLLQELETKDFKINELEAKLEKILNSIDDGILGLDPSGKILFANRSSYKCLKYSQEELLGKSIENFLLQRENFLTNFPKTEQNQQIQEAQSALGYTSSNYAALLTGQGEKLPIEYNTVLIENHHHIGAVISFRDISKRLAAERKLAYEASYDRVTSIPNRHIFLQVLDQTIRHGERNKLQLGLLYIDIHNLKQINHTFSPMQGDLFLKEITNRLQERLRKSDFLARIAGDEFALSIGEVKNIEDALVVAQKVKETINSPYQLDDKIIHPHCAIGVALFPQHGQTSEALLNHAEIAMYHAKEQGTDFCSLFNEEYALREIKQLRLEEDYYHAIKEKQLFLEFLPQHNLTTNKLVAVEALVRWQHPQAGLLYPNEFLKFPKKNRLCSDLSNFVLEKALDQFAQWLDNGIVDNHFYLSVNINLENLQDPQFVSDLTFLVEKFKIPSQKIQLEISESELMQDIATSEEVLNKLAKLNFRLAVDDFGTAYSSLLFLNRLPIHCLKIDVSFVKNIMADEIGATTVQGIVQLAKTFSMEVVAEGVEQKEQREFLAAHGCELAQGFLFSPPLSEQAIINYMGQKRG